MDIDTTINNKLLFEQYEIDITEMLKMNDKK